MLGDLLEVLRQPSGLEVLTQRLPLPGLALKGLLSQLETRGLVTTADPGVGACHSGCGSCSMQRFCPSGSKDREEPVNLLPKARIWRLTALGEAQLTPR